ncbi:MAG: cryptochrome/photolyase family protein [Caldilineaceae bacterium]
MNEPNISVWILGDQLLADHPALRAAEAENRPGPGARRAGGKRPGCVSCRTSAKLVLLLSAMRHYADELRGQGYHVDYVQAASVTAGLRQHVTEHKPARLITMAASEYAGRRFQQEKLPDRLGIPVTVVPNGQMLVEQYDPEPSPKPGKRVVMETFYRAMRRHFDVLLDGDGEPVGGQWNFDKENRKPLPKRLDVPAPHLAPDAVTRAVMDEVAAMDVGVGTVDGFALAVLQAAAEAAFADFITHRLPEFGPYEDAMSRRHAVLFPRRCRPTEHWPAGPAGHGAPRRGRLRRRTRPSTRWRASCGRSWDGASLSTGGIGDRCRRCSRPTHGAITVPCPASSGRAHDMACLEPR